MTAPEIVRAAQLEGVTDALKAEFAALDEPHQAMVTAALKQDAPEALKALTATAKAKADK